MTEQEYEHEKQRSLYQRVESLEDWRRTLDVSSAVQKQDLVYMDRRFDSIDKQIILLEKKLEESSSWIKRGISVVAILVLTAFVKFILDGGLTGV